MNDPLITLVGRLLAAVPGDPVFAAQGDHTITVTVEGAGSVSATVLWQGSNDKVGWATLATLSPAGTGSGAAKAGTTETYRYWRLNVTSLTGNSVSGVVASESAVAAASSEDVNSFFMGGAALVPDWVSAPWSVAIAASFAVGAGTDYGPQLVAFRSTSAYTYTANPMVPDHEGTLQATLPGELLHEGMRRVYNELRYTEALDATGLMRWTTANGLTVAPVYSAKKRAPWWVRNKAKKGGTVYKLTPGGAANSVHRWPDTTTGGIVYDASPRVFSLYAYADTPHQAELRVYVSGGATLASVIINVTTEEQLFALPFLPNGTSAYVVAVAPVTFAGTGAAPIYMHSPMVCRQTMNTTAPPSEYMPRDHVARLGAQLRDGAGVDGVSYFATTNGNTMGANGLVVEAPGTAIANYGGLGTGSDYTQLLCTDWATWSQTNMAAPVTGVAGPDGKPSAVEFLETSSDGSAVEAHYVSAAMQQSSVYGGRWVVGSACLKKRPAGARAWAMLMVVDVDGVTLGTAWVNYDTGAIGNTSGTLVFHNTPVSLRDGFRRFYIRYALKSGVGSPVNAQLRIYSVTGNGSTAHVGNPAEGFIVAFPNATSAIQNGIPTNAPVGSDRALPCPYVPNTNAAQAVTIPGQAAYFLIRNVIGQKNFAVSGVVKCMFDATAPYKGGTTGNLYSATAYIRCEQLPDVVTGYTDVDLSRTGLTIRPNYQNALHYSKWAYDLYTGWPSQFYWKPNTVWKLGQIVMPQDTLMDNKNQRRWLTCMVPGLGGATEPVGFTSPTPTWVGTPDTVTSIIDDNGVKWQCNVPNGILGSVEGYLGAHLPPPNPNAGNSIRYFFYSGDSGYGCWIDGVECVKQTQEQLDQGMSTELAAPPKVLYLGQMGTGDVSVTTAAAMGVHWMFHKRVVVRHSLPRPAVLAELAIA